MENAEPLSQLAAGLGVPWWLFAVVSQLMVIAATFVAVYTVRRWQSGVGVGRASRWRPLPDRLVLAGLPVTAGVFIAACGLYCLVWWPKPPAPRILEPDAAILCWLYCGVFMDWPWALATMLNGLALTAAGGLLLEPGTRRIGAWLAIVAGVVAFPLGMLGTFAGHWALTADGRRHRMA